MWRVILSASVKRRVCSSARGHAVAAGHVSTSQCNQVCEITHVIMSAVHKDLLLETHDGLQ